MMLIKSVTVLLAFAAVECATFQQRNIPVEIRYDEAVPILIQQRDDSKEPLGVKALKNLDAKVQLSPDELSQSLKHLPPQPVDIVETNGLKENNEHLEEPAEKAQEVGTTESKPLLLEALLEVEDFISNGLKRLKSTFVREKNQPLPDAEQWAGLDRAVNELLDEEKSKIQLRQTQAAAGGPPAPVQNQNIFQNLAAGLQNVFSNFTQTLQANQNNRPGGQGDEGTPGVFQGFINNLQGGFNNIVNTINNIGNPGPTTSSTVLGDTGTGGNAPEFPPSGIISNIVNNVQQFFGQIQGGGSRPGGTPATTAPPAAPAAPAGTQGDTGVNPPPPPAPAPAPGPQGPVQVIQSISSAINNFIQGNPRPPNTSGDEGSKPANGTNPNLIQSIGQNIGNAINNSPFNIFRPQSTYAPAAGGATQSTQNPIQAGISGIQNVGNQIQQLVTGLPGPSSTVEPTKYPEAETPAKVEESNAIDSDQSDVPSDEPKERKAEKEILLTTAK